MSDSSPVSSSPPPEPEAQPPARTAVRPSSPVSWAVALALAAMVGTLLFIGGYLAAGARSSGSCAAPNEAFVAFCQAYARLKEEFVDDLDDKTLAEGAIQGMFEYGVKDPFSGYMAPDDYRRALGDLSGEFSGIGAEMGVRNLEDPADLAACSTFNDKCALVVVAPLEDSPAEGAGIQAGDIVVAIDGDSVEGLSLEDAVARVRGDAGTVVTLLMRRGDREMQLRITRAKIQMREVSSRMLRDDIGYIALHGFSEASVDQFHDALQQLLDDGATSIVFDLRDNPGGFIESANSIASEFIADGVIFSQQSAADDVKTWEAGGEGIATDPALTLVVLVNGGSASASEIVAAALQENDRATVIGQHSFGKNTVQVWNELVNGGGVRITISRWFTPDHNTVAPDGVQPDIVVEVPDGTPPERDLFLERAVEFLTDSTLGGENATPTPTGGERPSGLAPELLPLLGVIGFEPSGQLVAAA